MDMRSFTVKEFAELMRVSPQHVRDCIRYGSLKAKELKASDKRTVWAVPLDMDEYREMARFNAQSWKGRERQ